MTDTWRFILVVSLVVTVGALLPFFADAAPAGSDWKLSADGYTTASDVREHNKLAQDIADTRAALAKKPADFRAALAALDRSALLLFTGANSRRARAALHGHYLALGPTLAARAPEAHAALSGLIGTAPAPDVAEKIRQALARALPALRFAPADAGF